MVSMRGPRRCAITLASTSTPSMAGVPTLISLPSLKRRTRPSFSDAPGSAVRRSTRIRSPGATRYCLPPLTTTADSELSGLGTARDCTKVGPGLGRPANWGAPKTPHHDPFGRNEFEATSTLHHLPSAFMDAPMVEMAEGDQVGEVGRPTSGPG